MNPQEIEDKILARYGFDQSQKSPLIVKRSRWKELPELFRELGYKTGAEIGVLKGDFSLTLCRAGLHVYAIDAWQWYSTYKDFRKQAHLDAYEAEAREKLKDHNCTIIKGWSSEIVDTFADDSLDFVFIDGNHALEYAIEDIAKWGKKVRKGGIIAGHDYFRARHSGNLMHVKDAVNAWTYVYGIKPWFVLSGDKCPSWFWVKK